MNADYVRTVQLLLAVVPAIFDTPAFAMKGGTALNLFLQDMPRLSVDIDVVFIPHELPREEALRAIGDELATAQARVEALGFSATLRKSREATTGPPMRCCSRARSHLKRCSRTSSSG